MDAVGELERICTNCKWRVRQIGIETGLEDYDEILKQCDNDELLNVIIGFHGLRGGVSVWTYEDASCDHWESDRED